MLVEIYGGNFRNKGAQLMVSTVVDELSKRIDGIEFCMAWRIDRSAAELSNANCKMIFPSHLYYRRGRALKAYLKLANTIGYWINERHLTPYNLVSAAKCDAVIDMSGYAFGDVWGPIKTATFAAIAQSYRKKNKPVIMLPQMLGPFENQACRTEFKKFAKEASLIYARDRVSKRCVEELGGFDEKLRTSADITIFYEKPDKPEEKSDKPDENLPTADVFLVPNSHVVNFETNDWTEETYSKTFKEIFHMIERSGLKPKFLIHDYLGKDGDLAQKIAASIVPEDPDSIIYGNRDPAKLKQTIAQAKFVVGSRFHGLVAALAHDIPTIAIGWAHKYGELLYDFGIEEFNVESSSEHDRILKDLLPKMLDSDSRNSLVDTVRSHRLKLASGNEAMWESVVAQLRHGKHKLVDGKK